MLSPSQCEQHFWPSPSPSWTGCCSSQSGKEALLAPGSWLLLTWLLLVHRYTLTVWTGQGDQLTPQDLLAYRQGFERSRIYYDLPPSLRTQLRDRGQDS